MTKEPKRKKGLTPYKSNEVTEWKKRYGLRLLEKGFCIKDICDHLDSTEKVWYEWKRKDRVFAKKVNDLQEKERNTGRALWNDLIWMMDKMRPYLQRHLTEKEACAEVGISYDVWTSLKKRMRKSDKPIAKWFLEEIESAKSKVFALAKNTLTSGIKVNPTLAFNFLKSTQPDIYTDGRKELTGAKWEKLFHAFPMKPWDYEDFVKRASTMEDDENE